MDNDRNKCAHDICTCTPKQGSDYCSDYCRDAVDQDIVEIRCDCGCPSCG